MDLRWANQQMDWPFFSKLIILAGLRKLESSIRTEVERMPILGDIVDHDVMGSAIREGMQKGGLRFFGGRSPSALARVLLGTPFRDIHGNEC